MIARIPARGQCDIEAGGANDSPEAKHLAPGPAREPIFSLEDSPGRDERQNDNSRPELRLQFFSVWLGDNGDFIFLDGGPEESGADDEITKAPQFDDEKLWFSHAGGDDGRLANSRGFVQQRAHGIWLGALRWHWLSQRKRPETMESDLWTFGDGNLFGGDPAV